MTVRRAAFWAALGTAALALAAVRSAQAFGHAIGATDGGWWPWGFGAAIAIGGAALAARLVGRRLRDRLADLGAEAESLARLPSLPKVRAQENDPELERLYAAFDAMRDSLTGLLERERSFARYASHELRTPVGALKVQLERVEIGSATASDVLPAVARQTARIEELIDALLALTRTRDQGSRNQQLRALLDETVESLGDAERERVYFIEPIPGVVVREAVLVRQALRNLVDNAVRHGAGPVTVRFEHRDDALTVRVRDMGAGIPGTVLRRLAEPTERRQARLDGHGLGLTLVGLIARALGGRLHLHNTDVGLEASIDLRAIVRGPNSADPVA